MPAPAWPSTRSPSAVRRGRRRSAVAAVLRADRLPLDIRHASKVDRTEVARQAARSWPAAALVTTGDEGAGHRRQRAAGPRHRPAADRARRRGHRDPAPPRGARPAARCSATSPTPTPCGAPSAVRTPSLHLAAKVDVVGPREEYERANVLGTSTLVSACRAAGVPRFVQVSSPSVAHAGRPLCGAGAEPADPASARGHYARTKAAAERRRPGRRLVPTWPCSPSGPTWCGGRATPSWSPDSWPAPGRVACPCSDRGRH